MIRVTLALFALVMVGGCTCSGCHSSPSPVDAGQALEASIPAPREQEPAKQLAAVDTEPVDAAVTDSEPPSGDIPSEVSENAPPTAELIAAFESDCGHQVDVVYEDMTGQTDAGECEARVFEQNCSPDQFGCWDRSEKCRDACAEPCRSCEAACTNHCETCKRSCDAGTCMTSCATARNDCRIACLRRLDTCRTKDCQVELDGCESDAEKRTREQCPHCDELRECQQAAYEKNEDPAACAKQFSDDAVECLEWCSPGQ